MGSSSSSERRGRETGWTGGEAWMMKRGRWDLVELAWRTMVAWWRARVVGLKVGSMGEACVVGNRWWRATVRRGRGA